jgi:hypothetical protein
LSPPPPWAASLPSVATQVSLHYTCLGRISPRYLISSSGLSDRQQRGGAAQGSHPFSRHPRHHGLFPGT